MTCGWVPLRTHRLCKRMTSRWQDLLGLGVFPLLGVLLGLRWLAANQALLFVYDDSYISLGFARHVALYGSPTLDGTVFWSGITSPLHVYLVGLFSLGFGSVEQSAIFVGLVSIALLVAVTYLWVREISGDKKTALVASFLTASSGWVIFDALSGLETVIYMALSVLVFYFVERRKTAYVGLFLGLCICTRPEGGLLFACVIAAQAFSACSARNPRALSSTIRHIGLESGLALAVVAPMLFASLAYTGSLLPSTALTKAYFFAELNLAPLVRATFFWNAVSRWYGTLICALPVVLVLMVFARHRLSRLYIYAYPLLFYLFYFFVFPGGLGHYWSRYQHIFLPIVFLLLSEGVVISLGVLRKQWRTAGAVLLAAILLLNQWQTLATLQTKYEGAIASTRDVNVCLAKTLQHNTCAGDVIAVHDIGTITYFLEERTVIDLVGLINPEMHDYYRSGAAAVPFQERQVVSYLVEKDVDYLVMFPAWEWFLNVNPEALPSSHLVYKTDPVFGLNSGYYVYRLE